MPVNRNALIRYRTIDNCLRNRQKRWTLDSLVAACSEALYEYEGIDKGVSRRSVQMDLQLMRSDKLGYNAPIVVIDRKYYTYEDPEYSITNIPLTDQDLGKLTEVVEILKQFKGFSHFQELSGMVQRLENKIHSAKTQQEPVIDFERNENLKGLEHIETLYQAIINKSALELHYQSFKARSSNTFFFHPYYLKEYRNRWFVIGRKKKNAQVMNLALDRILDIKPCTEKYVPRDGFNLNEFLKDVVGVSVAQGEEPQKVLFLADNQTAPYIRTKPIHHSQNVEEVLPHGVVFSLRVQLNFELERELLGFGDRIKIIAPERLKRNIRSIFSNALDSYNYEFENISLHHNLQKFRARGSAMIRHVFMKKEANAMKLMIGRYITDSGLSEGTHAIRNIFAAIPALKTLAINANLRYVLNRIDPGLFLVKAIYFDKTPGNNWYVTWHQDKVIQVKERIDTEGFTGWTHKDERMGVIPPDEILQNMVTVRIHLDDVDETNGVLRIVAGSHNRKLNDAEIATITQNSIATTCDGTIGTIQLMKPLLLHASSKATRENRHRRVLHLEFSSVDLPGGLEWADREAIH